MGKKIDSTETIGTCPHCSEVVPLQVVLEDKVLEYQGVCPEHGEFFRQVPHESFASLGEKVSTMYSLKSDKRSA